MSLTHRAAERREKRAQEMARGRQMTKEHMANGILDQLAMEFKLQRTWFVLDAKDEDARNWTISLVVPGAEPVVENFFDFPSNELRAAIALLNS